MVSGVCLERRRDLRNDLLVGLLKGVVLLWAIGLDGDGNNVLKPRFIDEMHGSHS